MEEQVPDDRALGEDPPILSAGPRPLEPDSSKAGRFAPAAWLLSLTLHLAAVACFLDRTSRYEVEEARAIDVELIFDIPFRNLMPSQIDTVVPSLSSVPPSNLTQAVDVTSLEPVQTSASLPSVEAQTVEPLSLPHIETQTQPAAELEPVRQGPSSVMLKDDGGQPLASTMHPVSEYSTFSDVGAPPYSAFSNPPPTLAPPAGILSNSEAVADSQPPALTTLSTPSLHESGAEPLAAIEEVSDSHAIRSSVSNANNDTSIPASTATSPIGAVPVPIPRDATDLRPMLAVNPPSLSPSPMAGASSSELTNPESSGLTSPNITEVVRPSEQISVTGTPASATQLVGSEPRANDNALAAVSVTHPQSPPSDTQRAVTDAVFNIECGRIKPTFDPLDGTVHLTGHISSVAEQLELVGRLSTIGGVQKIIQSELQIVGEPYCRVLSFLDRPEIARSSEQLQDVTAIQKPVQAGVMDLRAGMPLRLQLKAPEFSSYIYVDYFTSDGQVYHLLTAPSSGTEFMPNQSVVIGGKDGVGLKATIGPPFGLDMVVAVASNRLLPIGARPVAEPANAYLRVLDDIVARSSVKDPRLQLEYSYYLIRTTAK
jgi:hypothetical protein